MAESRYLFTTERLGMRPWVEADLEPFAAMNQDPDVMRFFPWLFEPEHTRKSVQRQMAQQEQDGFCFWATDELSTGEFVGFIGINKPGFKASFTPCIEIGWRLRKAAWGNGYATEGAKACLAYARDVLKIKEIFSFTALPNTPSERVMQKIGMQLIGTFRHPKIPLEHPLNEHVLYHISLKS